MLRPSSTSILLERLNSRAAMKTRELLIVTTNLRDGVDVHYGPNFLRLENALPIPDFKLKSGQSWLVVHLGDVVI